MKGRRRKAREDGNGSDDKYDIDDDDYNGDATVTSLGQWLWFVTGARLQFSILMTKVVDLDDKSRELNIETKLAGFLRQTWLAEK